MPVSEELEGGRLVWAILVVLTVLGAANAA